MIHCSVSRTCFSRSRNIEVYYQSPAGKRVHDQKGNIGTADRLGCDRGEGEPVISFGSDIDGLPTTSQYPGVSYHKPIIEGAPGHGEGHNSGQAVNVVAALALKDVMQKQGIKGTLMLWRGWPKSCWAARLIWFEMVCSKTLMQ